MLQGLEKIEEKVTQSNTWGEISDFLNKHIDFGEKISISILDIIIVITVIVITTVVLKILLRILTRNLPEADKGKFNVVYGYFRWLIYLIILLITSTFRWCECNSYFCSICRITHWCRFGAYRLYFRILFRVYLFL